MQATSRVVLCAAAIGALGLAGCSASVSVGEHLNNPDKAISGLIHPTPKSVTCPDNISPKAGTKFTCNVVTSDGGKGTINVLEYKQGSIKLVSGGGALAAATRTTAATTTSG